MPAPLVLHLAHDLPEAAVELAHQVLRRHAHVLEAHLAEVVAARHVLDRAAIGDAGRAHVDDQLRQPLVLRGVGVGADDQVDPVGRRRPRVPDLLAVHHEVVAVALGAGADRRHVGSGVRLGHADAPRRGAVEDGREVGGLLLGGAELQQGRTHLAVGEPGGGHRGPLADERLEHQEPLEGRLRPPPPTSTGQVMPSQPRWPSSREKARSGAAIQVSSVSAERSAAARPTSRPRPAGPAGRGTGRSPSGCEPTEGPQGACYRVRTILPSLPPAAKRS